MVYYVYILIDDYFEIMKIMKKFKNGNKLDVTDVREEMENKW
ncbi:hypothetical protein HMPREF9013_1194 [Bulleidia extructa W1219]|jgi:hypothetical protein|uniref:Uncharacterized protein n=1 Tax=Bulleidia extructa W1219 TaxID=679192 RepID=D2MP79_9FIRM|nr:hypothetical protein HMPREF9013_1194 [Bulleidia extructa W1219]